MKIPKVNWIIEIVLVKEHLWGRSKNGCPIFIGSSRRLHNEDIKRI